MGALAKGTWTRNGSFCKRAALGQPRLFPWFYGDRPDAAALAATLRAMANVDVVVFGAGFTGSAVCRAALGRGLTVLGVVQSQASAEKLREHGIEATTESCERVAETRVGATTHAVITFPATGAGELSFAPLLARARAVSYLSTTGVYEDLEGVIDDATALPESPSPKYGAVRVAERAFRAVGAAVLRAPGIYGAERGLHVRLARGEFRMSGDGQRFASRIHVEDLAELLLASARTPGETFVVGDLEPCRQIEMVSWLCDRLGLPLPASAPLSEVHETLRRNRRVDGSRALASLGVTLRYPSYREAFVRGK
jgi:nucleoside-diphosphate-sugar epimerase